MKNKARADATRRVSDFSQAVLVEYIRQHCLLPQLEDFIRIETHLEHVKVREQIDAIINKKRGGFPTDPEKASKRLREFLIDKEKLNALRQRQEELLKIQFPFIYTEKAIQANIGDL